ncbi:MAG TPA: hypothetical protein VG841_09900 [Caulobacterales bacterium]|nr:hypothetical protein [Caulobacterales bacterium]
MLGHRHIWRAWLLTLAFLAVGARVAVPPGYMPSQSADGQLIVTLCGGQTAALDLGGKHEGQRQDGKAHAPCAYAAAATPVDAPQQADVASPLTRAVQIRLLSPCVHVGAGLAAPPPPSRGPPILS